MERLTGLGDRRRVQLHLQPPPLDVRGERHHSIAQRAGKDFLRIERSNQRDVDVAAAFETIRHFDPLHGTHRVRLEPNLRIHFVALDRDQTAAGIRRRDADLDFFAGIILRFRELHLQLRVLVQRAFHDAAADHGKPDTTDFAVVLVAQLDDVIARLLRRELVTQSIGADRELFCLRDALFQHRLIGVAPVVLLRDNGNVFLRDHVQCQVFERDLVQLRIDGNQVDCARRGCVDVFQVAVALVADDVRQRRDERRSLAGNAPAAFAFKRFREKPHRVGRVREPIQLQVQLRLAIGIRVLFAEIDGFRLPVLLLVELRIVKAVVLELVERERGRRKFDAALDLAVARRRPIKIRKRD